jgi:hypothetical protein
MGKCMNKIHLRSEITITWLLEEARGSKISTSLSIGILSAG